MVTWTLGAVINMMRAAQNETDLDAKRFKLRLANRRFNTYTSSIKNGHCVYCNHIHRGYDRKKDAIVCTNCGVCACNSCWNKSKGIPVRKATIHRQ